MKGRQLLFAFPLLSCALFAGRAMAAAPTCAIDSITDFDLGAVDSIGGSVDAPATLTYHRASTGFLGVAGLRSRTGADSSPRRKLLRHEHGNRHLSRDAP